MEHFIFFTLTHIYPAAVCGEGSCGLDDTQCLSLRSLAGVTAVCPLRSPIIKGPTISGKRQQFFEGGGFVYAPHSLQQEYYHYTSFAPVTWGYFVFCFFPFSLCGFLFFAIHNIWTLINYWSLCIDCMDIIYVFQFVSQH